MTYLVNLDAHIVRSDFEEVKSDLEPQSARLPDSLRLCDLVSSVTYTALRKPDYQRETACWQHTRVAEFVRNFVEGDLLPAVILWRSPASGNIFVVDGTHRLSALIAWVRDDYGDKATSLAYFGKTTPPEQRAAAQKTRDLINKLVGPYEMLRSAAKHPERYDPAVVIRARNADIFTIPVLWAIGNGVIGQATRRQPKRLAGKLLAIRKRLDLSQQEMARRLHLKTSYAAVHAFERGKDEPELLALLKYARLGGVTLEQLVDDKMKLPGD